MMASGLKARARTVYTTYTVGLASTASMFVAGGVVNLLNELSSAIRCYKAVDNSVI